MTKMLGQMYLKHRQERSYNGVPVRVLKSAIQKYARRGMLEKGVWCAIELDLFRFIEVDNDGLLDYVRRYASEGSGKDENAVKKAVKSKAKAIRTTLIHRFLVMVSEEINIAVPWMPVVINDLYRAWQANRNQECSRKLLVDMYTHLVLAKKVRLISDLKSTYLLPPDYVEPARLPDLQALHADLIHSLGLSHLFEGAEEVPENLLAKAPFASHLLLNDMDEECQCILNGILYHLTYQNDHVFFWLKRLIDRHRDPQGRPQFGGRQDPLRVVWDLLFAFAEHCEHWGNASPQSYPYIANQVRKTIKVLHTWYETLTHRERPIYLYHALLLLVRRDTIAWETEIPHVDTPRHDVDALYQVNLSGKVIDLDDFVFDIHTGRRRQDALTHFAREGALVVNEETALVNHHYRQLYHALKTRLDQRRTGSRWTP